MEDSVSSTDNRKSIQKRFIEISIEVREFAEIFFWLFCMWIESILDWFKEKISCPVIRWVSQNQYAVYLIAVTFVAVSTLAILVYLKP